MKKTLTLVLMTFLAISITGCFGESDTENAIEDVGEKIEEVSDNAADSLEDAVE